MANMNLSTKTVLKQVALFRFKDGSTERFQKARLVIGSYTSADLRLSGDGVAPIHAVLEWVKNEAGNDEYHLYDLASQTGVYVNSEKTFHRVLKSGDRILIGRHELVLSLENRDKLSRDSFFGPADDQQVIGSSTDDLKALVIGGSEPAREIFDYSQTSVPAVEVILSWSDTVLDVQHFTVQPQVTIGSSQEADFGIPAVLPQEVFPLLSQANGQFTLQLDPKMKAVIQRKGELRELKDSILALEKGDLVKLSVGSVDFFICFTDAPPRLKRKSHGAPDPFLFKSVFTSIALTLLFFFALSQIPVPRYLEAEQVPERVATILYTPEKFLVKKEPVEKAQPAVEQPKQVPPPVTKVEIEPGKQPIPKEVPKEMNVGKKEQQAKAKRRQGQNEAREGEGARAKGKEGTRGKKNAAPGKEHQERAKRPSPESGKGSGGSNSQIGQEGNVEFLKGAASAVENILGAASQNLGKKGAELKGFGGFDTQGAGGKALSGTGKGGGGDADSLGGLGKKGQGGGRVGTGLGAAGSGSGIIGGKTRVVLRSGGPEETVVIGSIDASAIEAALMRHRDEFRLCYEREINAENPALAGRVSTSFVIGASGRVTQAGVLTSTLKNVNTERCILAVIKRIDFPIPRGGGMVEVTYPFKFTPAK